jgi:hypothetical protein
MKIIHSRNVIRLGRTDTKSWENSGPEGYRFRRSVREMAQEMADTSGRNVEIYASASAGGWMADQIQPEHGNY